MRSRVHAALPQRPSYPTTATDSLPDDLTPSVKLKTGYVRYVRILRALADDSADTIRCETCIQPEQEDVCYLALSYAWGDPTPTHPILVDGECRLVADNLWDFLCEAKRKPERFPHLLWIDALSIDQSDLEERRHQVGIMSTIFQNASKVVVWLGGAYDDSDVAIRVLIFFWDESQLRYTHALDDEFDEMAEQFAKKHAENREEWAARVPDAIASLCQRPYWKRLWVFQELRHAEDIQVMCGSLPIPWAAFRNLWVVVVDLRGFEDGVSELLNNSLATRMMTLRTKPINFSLWNLLKETRNLDCADEHDRVYALLSVATEGHEDIEADYHASLSSLGHSILRNKYASALRRPTSLDDVMMDCEFLRDVLRLSWTDMFGYGNSYGGVWTHKAGSPGSSFAGWAEHHRHPAVTKLFLDTV
jgi:hypothetical protein